MNWNALSAIGTTLAAIVGVAGIWINLCDKKRKIHTNFERVPSFKICLSNNSLRTVVITKMIYCIETHVFRVEYFEGLRELALPPATTQNIDIIKQDVYRAYCKTNMSAICSPNDNVKIILYDNYGRKYTIKTDLRIGAFQQ